MTLLHDSSRNHALRWVAVDAAEKYSGQLALRMPKV